MKIICCIGHVGRESKGYLDFGASAHGSHEASLVLSYISGIAHECAERGTGFAVIGHGSYAEQAVVVNEMADPGDIILACHVNASRDPSVDYGAIFYDERSKLGKAAAKSMIYALQDHIGSQSKTIASKSGHWTKNAFACIQRYYAGPAAALCLEPLFITNPGTARDSDDLHVLGQNMAEDLITYMDSK